MIYRNIVGFFFFFLAVNSQLSAQVLSENELQAIVDLLNKREISSEQSAQIAAVLPKPITAKSLFDSPRKISSSKRRGQSAEITPDLSQPTIAKRLFDDPEDFSFSQCRKMEVSQQSVEITSELPTPKAKRSLAGPENPSPTKRIKTDKSENILPEGAKSVAKNGDHYAYLSPKKSGPFGKDLTNRKEGDAVRNRKDVIYIWTSVAKHEDQYVKYVNRIDASKYAHMKIADALLDIEVNIRTWIKQDKLLYKRTFDAGLTQDVSDRARHYKAKIENLEDPREKRNERELYYHRVLNSSRRLRWFDLTQRRNFNERMSPIIEKIPENLIKPAEVLVGHLFNTPSKGSSVLGDKEAYDLVTKYLATEERADELKARGLDSVVEDLKEKEDNFMLAIGIAGTPIEKQAHDWVVKYLATKERADELKALGLGSVEDLVKVLVGILVEFMLDIGFAGTPIEIDGV